MRIGPVEIRPVKLKPFLICLGAALVYPVIVLITSEKKLLKFMDALTITGLVLLALGVILSMVRHGDFDIMQYVATRRSKNEGKSFEAFKADKKEERKDSMNYPFWVSLLLLLLAGILTFFVY